MKIIILGIKTAGKTELAKYLAENYHMTFVDAKTVTDSNDYTNADIVITQDPNEAAQLVSTYQLSGEHIIIVYACPDGYRRREGIIRSHTANGMTFIEAVRKFNEGAKKDYPEYEKFENLRRGQFGEDASILWVNMFRGDDMQHAADAILSLMCDPRMLSTERTIFRNMNAPVTLKANEFSTGDWAVICDKFGLNPDTAKTVTMNIGGMEANVKAPPKTMRVDADQTGSNAAGNTANSTHNDTAPASCEDTKTPSNDYQESVLLKYRENDGPLRTMTLSLPELSDKLGLSHLVIESVGVAVSKDGHELTAMISGDEAYPSIAVDGEDGSGNALYLSHVELPNEDYPDAITARLYAGYANFESDEPMVIVAHKLYSDKKLQELADDPPAARMNSKCVYVDYTIGAAVPMNSDTALRDHLVDL